MGSGAASTGSANAPAAQPPTTPSQPAPAATSNGSQPQPSPQSPPSPPATPASGASDNVTINNKKVIAPLAPEQRDPAKPSLDDLLAAENQKEQSAATQAAPQPTVVDSNAPSQQANTTSQPVAPAHQPGNVVGPAATQNQAQTDNNSDPNNISL
jgi:hypothetical protein